MGPSVNSLHWTLFTLFLSLGQVNSLLLWDAFLFIVFFFFSFLSFLKTVMRVALPPLFLLISSKVINVLYSAELVWIPLVWLCKAILSCSVSVHSFPRWVIWMNVVLLTFMLNPSTPYSDFSFSPLYLCIAYLYFSNPPCPPHSHFQLLSQLYIL